MVRSGADVTDGAGPRASRPRGLARLLGWRHSLWGKVAAFMLAGFVLAYGLGAGAGLAMLERSLREQWWRQAEMNAQIASAAIRRIYTFVAVEADARGQVVRILAERALGDPASVLDTGFSPVDVLALAAAQTRQNVWLFAPQVVDGRLVAIADAWGSGTATLLAYDDPLAMQALGRMHVGFARIGGEEHFVSALPVTTSGGEVSGIVVSSIGPKAQLYETRNALVRGSLLALLGVLFVAGCTVIWLMRRFFRPVPALVEAITRIARNDTGTATPFQGRDDEIGSLAAAIETLREAVIEREHLRDVKEAALRLEHMAHHDVLTGLPNRAFLNRVLGDATQMLAEGRHVNFMLFDLDRFKAVNDDYGHVVGDALLAAMAGRVLLLLGPGDVAARLGGDEFAIVQQVDRQAQREASRLASRLVEELGRPFAIQGHELRIGTSVGIACAPDHGRTAHELLRRADVALYAAKHAGRGNYMFYAEGMVMRGSRTLPG